MAADESTRAKILNAAGETFAEQGFQAATIRDICERANVNVAAINYHFGDKLGLYTEVLRWGIQCERPTPPDLAIASEECLFLFIRTLLQKLFRADRAAWYFRLMAREVAQPTPALQIVVEEMIRPTEGGVRTLVASIMGLPREDDRVRFSTLSVVSQCIYYMVASPVLRHLWPELEMTPARLDQIADHVARFSLAGMKAAAAERGVDQ